MIRDGAGIGAVAPGTHRAGRSAQRRREPGSGAIPAIAISGAVTRQRVPRAGD